MTVCTPLVAILRASPELTAKLGDRIRTGDAGSVDVRPYLLLWEITNGPVDDLEGETGTEISTVQLDLYADTAAEAAELARKVKTTLAAISRGNVAGCFFRSLMRQPGSFQRTDRIAGGSAGMIHRVTLEYRIHHSA